MSNRHTAQEMREMASAVLNECEDSEHGLLYPSRHFSGHLFYPDDIAAMLLQAADMIDRGENVLKANAKHLRCRHKDADAALAYANYILRGDAGEEER